MKKYIFIIAFIILSVFIFWQFYNLKTANEDISSQAEKLSTDEDLDSDTNVLVEDAVSSQLSTDDLREKEIQDKIEKFGKNETGIPVLMYHFFYDSSAGQTGADNNCLEISKFEEQLKYLKENEFFFPTFEELSAFINGTLELPKKSVILTIDDGNVTFFVLAAPLIEKYEVPVTSFVITSVCDSTTLEQYQSDYIQFESHSHDLHRAGKNGKDLLVNLSYQTAYNDIMNSVNILNSKEAFCYPFGHYNDTAKQVLKDIGYKIAFTTKGGRVKKGMDSLELPRVRILRDDSLASFISKVN